MTKVRIIGISFRSCFGDRFVTVTPLSRRPTELPTHIPKILLQGTGQVRRPLPGCRGKDFSAVGKAPICRMPIWHLPGSRTSPPGVTFVPFEPCDNQNDLFVAFRTSGNSDPVERIVEAVRANCLSCTKKGRKTGKGNRWTRTRVGVARRKYFDKS